MKVDIYSDKSSLVLRVLLSHPGREWVIDRLLEHMDVSRALVGKVVLSMREKGYLRGTARGRKASFSLRHARELLDAWVRVYAFNQNTIQVFYSPHKNLLKRLNQYFKPKNIPYAFTLHTAANLLTSHVNDPNVYIYLSAKSFDAHVQEAQKDLHLLKLKKGGNIFFVKPAYKKSVFYEAQKVRGFPIVSNLQLYLDLFQFPQRGYEHAQYLERILKEKGVSLVPKN